MREALALARRGWGQVAPNPLVGAVVVRDGAVVGAGWHERYGAPHAEPNALADAGDRARGATVYVTLEPCAHHGKTPPCADALIAAGVSRVVVAAPDPNPVARGGAARLRAAGIDVTIGVLEDESRELNAPFFHALASDRPWVTLKLALSLDAAIAEAGNVPRWMTGPEARDAVHELRAGHDAVAVGIGTAIADDPSLTVRHARPPRLAPLRVVFDHHARLPLGSALVRTAGEVPTLVVTGPVATANGAALRAAGVELLAAGSTADALRQLRERGVRALLVEGGAGLAASLLDDRLVDRLIIIHAPVLLGAGAVGAFARVPPPVAAALGRLALRSVARLGDDVLTVYAPRSTTT